MEDPSGEPERWLPVPGYEDTYAVSDRGRVKSLARAVRASRAGGFRRLPERIMRPSVSVYGYPAIKFYIPAESPGEAPTRRTTTVHSLVLTAFVGPRPPGYEACHWDGNPLNNNLANLRWDTRLGNRADQRRHGTHKSTRKTHCLRGHEFNMENTKRRPNGRMCRECARVRALAGYYRRKARKDEAA